MNAPPPAPSVPADLPGLLRDSRHWELLRQRHARETLRSVFRVNGHYLVKKFEIPLETHRFHRPWLAEAACLRRLDGSGAPRSFGWFEETAEDHRTVWLVKEFIAGEPVDAFTPADLPAAARLLARVHSAGILTDDASAGNFLRTLDGSLVFLDFGRARLRRRSRPCSSWTIGWELAKLRREGFHWNNALWRAFLPLYFDALRAAPLRRVAIRAAADLSTALRMTRKTLQGKPARS